MPAASPGVVQKFLKKGGFLPEAVQDLTGKGDQTNFGVQTSGLAEGDGGFSFSFGIDDFETCAIEVLILPDRTPFGPMYIARLRRE